jgi:hypothetical protein
METKLWVVYIQDLGYEPSTGVLGVVSDLDTFKKMAKETYGVDNPIKDEYGRGSLHYEYSVQRSEKYSDHYALVAEPTKML